MGHFFHCKAPQMLMINFLANKLLFISEKVPSVMILICNVTLKLLIVHTSTFGGLKKGAFLIIKYIGNFIRTERKTKSNNNH